METTGIFFPFEFNFAASRDEVSLINHSRKYQHCLQFLLGVKMAPRETENNTLADKQRALWYVMVFSGVVNYVIVLVRQ